MKHKMIRQIVLPLITALIWGTAFVFQSEGAQYIGPFTFMTLRSIAAALFLGIVLLIRRALNRKKHPSDGKAQAIVPAQRQRARGKLIVGGILCGIMLATASNLQQAGLGNTAPGKAAFITALYVVLVPVFGLFFGHRVRPMIWGTVGLAVIGLYFLCIDGAMRIEPSDFLVFLCALAFVGQIIVIDRFSPHVDGISMSFIQFCTSVVISAVGMCFETVTLSGIVAALLPVLYVGVFSGGIAYTLQILAQKNSNPTVVSLLLSLESVFAVVAAGIMRGQWLSGREWIGSALMLIAVALSQLPEKKKREE